MQRKGLMGNLTLPTPVALAGGVICVLGGYLLGAITGAGSPDLATATVASYDQTTNRLCLVGDGVDGEDGAQDGKLCGNWRRAEGSVRPDKGDEFRFLSMTLTDKRDGAPAGQQQLTVIYGDVAR